MKYFVKFIVSRTYCLEPSSNDIIFLDKIIQPRFNFLARQSDKGPLLSCYDFGI